MWTGQGKSVKIRLSWQDVFSTVCLGCIPYQRAYNVYWQRKSVVMAGGPPNRPVVLALGDEQSDQGPAPGGALPVEHIYLPMEGGAGDRTNPSTPTSTSVSKTPSPTDPHPLTPEGMDCYGNERQALADLGRFFNNPTLSDVKLRVGGRTYYAHKLVLINVSDVFERMLSADWQDANKQEVELHEDIPCVRVFGYFLRYLYTHHLVLNAENALPVLILSDKYNVIGLRQVCVHFACAHVIPRVQLKEVFHVWFQYATRGHHRALIQACVSALAVAIEDVAYSAEWETEWLGLDPDQLVELLRSSDLVIRDEYELWGAVVKWLTTPLHPVRAGIRDHLLREILPHVRFPMMTPEQLSALEETTVVAEHMALFAPFLLKAYRYHALPLAARMTASDFNTAFLLRNYTALRWDKRLIVASVSSIQKCSEVSLRFTTRASTFPAQTWEWELKLYPKGFSSTGDDLRCMLYSNLLLDQPRPVEFLLSIVSESRILCSVTGKKNFSKNRYTTDTELDKKISVAALNAGDSVYVNNDKLYLQIILRPVE